MLLVDLAIAKTTKYARRDGGDTAEVIERPGGGLTAVLVDGQGSGRAAKLLSQAVAGKVMTLIKEGVRDGAAARSAHDYLYQYRGGQVSATLDIVSVDLASQTIVLSRNSHCPSLLDDSEGIRLIPSVAGAIGPHRHTRPAIQELPLVTGTRLIVFSDGILQAGQRAGRPLDLPAFLSAPALAGASASPLADALLAAALAADDGRPQDDMTIVALTIQAGSDDQRPLIQRLAVSWPLDSLITPRL